MDARRTGLLRAVWPGIHRSAVWTAAARDWSAPTACGYHLDMGPPGADMIASRLQADWGLGPISATPLTGGMNSQTWLVTDGTTRWVAKSVPADTARRFEAGLRVAAAVEATGIPAGAPVPRPGGRLTAIRGGRTIALLTFVEGVGLTGEGDGQQRLIGTVLARAHLALRGADVPADERFNWLDPDADHLGLRPWLRPAIADAITHWERLPPESLTWGLLHSDPAPEAFLASDDGRCGLIDWDRALMGPLMYDLASAVMYVGGPAHARALIEAYATAGVLGRVEIERTLRPMLQLRWAVQADYFAMRIASNDLTGINGSSENDQGLEDARQALAGFAS